MSNMSRRNFVKMAGAAIAGVSLTGLSGFVSGCGAKAADSKSSAASTTNANKASVQASDKAKVYFTKHIDAEHLQKLYEKVNSEISGKIAIKPILVNPMDPIFCHGIWYKPSRVRYQTVPLLKQMWPMGGHVLPPSSIGKPCRPMAGPSARWILSMKTGM